LDDDETVGDHVKVGNYDFYNDFEPLELQSEKQGEAEEKKKEATSDEIL
jgi:hypothetical protein